MLLLEFFLFMLVGCGVGFLAGLFGVGGGFIMVPILVLSYEHSGVSPSVLTHLAIGTSLFAIIFGSMASAYQHQKQGNMDWRSVFILGFSSAITAFATTRLAASLSGGQLRGAFVLILMAAAIKMMTEGQAKAMKHLELSEKPSLKGLLGTGGATGVVSTLAGIGGGVFIIPLMYNFLHFPLRLAIGTSSAAIVITALFSVTGYILNGMGRPGLPAWSLGFVDLQRGAALAVGMLLMGRVGAYASSKIHPFHLRKVFTLFVFLLSVYMLLK
jgi:uncharacterized membrane protein YfcA